MKKRMQPKQGVTVFDHEGVPITGPIVVETTQTYYRRRIADGDLVPFRKTTPKKEAVKDGS